MCCTCAVAVSERVQWPRPKGFQQPEAMQKSESKVSPFLEQAANRTPTRMTIGPSRSTHYYICKHSITLRQVRHDRHTIIYANTESRSDRSVTIDTLYANTESRSDRSVTIDTLYANTKSRSDRSVTIDTLLNMQTLNHAPTGRSRSTHYYIFAGINSDS